MITFFREMYPVATDETLNKTWILFEFGLEMTM